MNSFRTVYCAYCARNNLNNAFRMGSDFMTMTIVKDYLINFPIFTNKILIRKGNYFIDHIHMTILE